MQQSTTLVGLFAGVLALSACRDESESPPAHAVAVAASGPRSDVELIDAMTPHHDMAVMMAQQVVERGEDAELKAMAAKMIEAQRQENAEMKALRAELAAGNEAPEMAPGSQAGAMAEMSKLEGEELDRRFLEEMIPHHAGAIHMAHEALPHLKSEELREISTKNITDQAREIAQMQAMLDDKR